MTSKLKNADRIRTVLRDSEGLTAAQIAERVDRSPELVRVVLNQMHDAYISRWERTRTGHGYFAVWSVAHVPPNAPRPLSVPVDRREYDKAYRERKKAEKAAQAADPTTPKTTWVKVPPWPKGQKPH